MIAAKNSYIGSAYQQLQVISQDRQKRMEYEAREKAIRDHNQLMLESEQRGLQQGLRQGIEQGIRQGIEQGVEQGMQQGLARGIREMIIDNLEEQIPEERILAKLQKRFCLSEETAKRYLADVSNGAVSE